MRALFSYKKTLQRDQNGATAIVFALMLIPMFIVIGFTVDFQRAQSAKLTLQASLDAAALAGARQMQTNPSDADAIRNMATVYFNEEIKNVAGDVDCPSPVVNVNQISYRVTVDADCSLPTIVAGLVGSKEWKVGATAQATPNQSTLELALMLDVSGSMNNNDRLEDLQVAAIDAIETLISDSNELVKTRIALAPYATALNAGSYAEAAVGSDYDSDRSNPNCVSERTGTASKTDDAPGPNKYIGYEASSCPSDEILPLTVNAGLLEEKINALSANGYTAGHLGIAWSWYLISPEWSDFWPAGSAPEPYDQEGLIKAVILMTDGSFNQTFESALGSSTNQSQKLCDEMKDAGVIIYSVAFQAPYSGEQILSYCASSDDTYFEPETGDELGDVYREIAASLSRLRLTM